MKRTVPGVVARAGDVARRLGITRGLRQRLPRWGADFCVSRRDASFAAGGSVPFILRDLLGGAMHFGVLVPSGGRVRAASQIG